MDPITKKSRRFPIISDCCTAFVYDTMQRGGEGITTDRSCCFLPILLSYCFSTNSLGLKEAEP